MCVCVCVLNYACLESNRIDLRKIPINLVSSRMREC